MKEWPDLLIWRGTWLSLRRPENQSQGGRGTWLWMVMAPRPAEKKNDLRSLFWAWCDFGDPDKSCCLLLGGWGLGALRGGREGGEEGRYRAPEQLPLSLGHRVTHTHTHTLAALEQQLVHSRGSRASKQASKQASGIPAHHWTRLCVVKRPNSPAWYRDRDGSIVPICGSTWHKRHACVSLLARSKWQTTIPDLGRALMQGLFVGAFNSMASTP